MFKHFTKKNQILLLLTYILIVYCFRGYISARRKLNATTIPRGKISSVSKFALLKIFARQKFGPISPRCDQSLSRKVLALKFFRPKRPVRQKFSADNIQCGEKSERRKKWAAKSPIAESPAAKWAVTLGYCWCYCNFNIYGYIGVVNGSLIYC